MADGETAGGAWSDLRRRKVVQWVLGYAAVAWTLLQVLEYLAETYDWPPAIRQVAVPALSIGSLFVLVLAWYHGAKGAQRVSRPEFALLTAALLLLGGSLWWFTARLDDSAWLPASAGSPIKHAVPTDAPSVAVLPFVNMSADPEQEYFSDGLSEEILNALARTPGLYVPARTSSFQFKGKAGDVAKFAALLGVAHVLEGSVRKAGGRVRITAQLVKADDGYHVWSQTYDRELKDIFAIQTEISNAIAEALKLRLTAQQKLAGKGASPTSNMDAYEAYLLGRHEVTKNELKKAIEHLQTAVNLDPQFAPAHAALARAILVDSMERMGMTWTAERDAALRRAKEILAKAQDLDPEHPDVLAVAGFLEAWQLNDERALELYERSLAINPSDGLVLTWRNQMLGRLGRYDQLLAASLEAVKRDPLSVAALNFRISTLIHLGRRGEAGPVVERLRSLDEVRGQDWLAEIAGHEGDRPGAIRHCIDALKAGGSDRSCGFYTFAALGLREEVLSRVLNPAAGQFFIGEYAEAARLARIAAEEDPTWWQWDLVHWLWIVGDFEGSWQFSVQARESDRKGAGYTGWGRDPVMLLSAADSARRLGKLEDARQLRDQAAAVIEAVDRAAEPFTAANDFKRAMLHAYDGRQDDAAAALIAALPRDTIWMAARAARDYPLFEEVRKRPDFQAAMRRQQATLDRQRDEVLQILCGPVPPPEEYQPAPETCARRHDSQGGRE